MYIHNLSGRLSQIALTFQDRCAVAFPTGEKLTYRQLMQLADGYGKIFKARNLKPGQVVAIAGVKQSAVIAAILACLKQGMTYTIFDPNSPENRLTSIFDVCRPVMIIAPQSIFQSFSIPDTMFKVKTEEVRPADEPLPPVDFPATTPAYIMFTSGSTGVPKGAVITHANLGYFIDWTQSAFSITPEDVIGNVNPLYFDNAVFDVYGALFNGACLAAFPADLTAQPARLVQAFDEMGCTQWFSVPTLLIYLQTMKVLNRNSFKTVKRIIFGGEGYPKARLKHLYALFGERIDFYNVYGPTECTCICSMYRIKEDDFKTLNGFPPLGSMIPHFGWAILDEHKLPVAVGEQGELCLTGPCVGAGYYNDVHNTQRHFITNPLNSAWPEPMYATGDLVSYNPEDGKIYIHGRIDNQVKHKGYRIELEEIETALCRLEGVEQASVVHGAHRGLSRLVAVVSGAEQLNEKKLRQDLKKYLPDYMIPNEIHFMRRLPVNANGKVNRHQIRALYFKQKDAS